MRQLKVAVVCGLAVLILPAVAKAQPDAKKLLGKWEAKVEVDEKKLEQLLADQGAPPDLLETVLEQAKTQIGNAVIGLEFKEENKLVFSSRGIPAPQDNREGTWEVIKEEKGKIILKSKGPGGEEEEMTLTFDGDDQFTMTNDKLKDAPIKAPVFKRIKPDADKDADKDAVKDSDKSKDGSN